MFDVVFRFQLHDAIYACENGKRGTIDPGSFSNIQPPAYPHPTHQQRHSPCRNPTAAAPHTLDSPWPLMRKHYYPGNRRVLPRNKKRFILRRRLKIRQGIGTFRLLGAQLFILLIYRLARGGSGCLDRRTAQTNAKPLHLYNMKCLRARPGVGGELCTVGWELLGTVTRSLLPGVLIEYLLCKCSCSRNIALLTLVHIHSYVYLKWVAITTRRGE